MIVASGSRSSTSPINCCLYLEGVGFHLLWPELWPLAIIAAVTLPIAAWLFRHRLTNKSGNTVNCNCLRRGYFDDYLPEHRHKLGAHINLASQTALRQAQYFLHKLSLDLDIRDLRF